MSQGFEHVPFREIVERIKDKISHNVSGRVLDRHVAEAIGLKAASIPVYRQRNSVPWTNVLMFCETYDVSSDWLIFDRDITHS